MSERLRGRDLLLICVAVLLTYHLAFVHQWAMDDFHFIQRNPAVTGGPQLPLLRAVETPGGVFYRPLSMGLFSLVHALFGGGPRAFHVLALAGHALASCLVAALTARMSTRWAGLAAGCLFAVHPVHVEAVASITNSTEVFASACSLAALWAWASHGGPDAPASTRRRALVAVYALGLAGLLFKESAVTLPAAMLVLERTEPFRGRRPIATAVTVASVSSYLALRHLAVRGVFIASVTDGLWLFPRSSRVFTVLEIVSRYARLLALPGEFSADYRGPVFGVVSAPSLSALAGGAILLALLVTLVAALRRATVVTAALAWVLVGLGLYLHVLPIIPLMAERFLYLPSVGFCILVGVGLSWLRDRTEASRLAAVVLVSVCLWFGALAANRNLDWTNLVALWGAEIENHRGGSAFARANYGLALADAGQRAQGVRWLESSVCDREGRVEYASELATVLLELDVDARAGSLARVRGCLSARDPRVTTLARRLAGGAVPSR
jgi:hypothetical protein